MDYTVKNVYGKTSKNPVAVRVPGSKSITARAFLIAAAAKGESVLYGAQFSDDCKTFLNCLEILGIGIKRENFAVKINGCGRKIFTCVFGFFGRNVHVDLFRSDEKTPRRAPCERA